MGRIGAAGMASPRRLSYGCGVASWPGADGCGRRFCAGSVGVVIELGFSDGAMSFSKPAGSAKKLDLKIGFGDILILKTPYHAPASPEPKK